MEAPDLNLRVPDQVGEFIGWRAWKLHGKNERLPVLASVTHSGTVWFPNRWTLAECGGSTTCRRGTSYEHGGPGIPGASCSCGLYAAKTRSQLVSLGYGKESWQGDGVREPIFIGEVALAGKVIPGTQGWRAEKGRIARLYVPFHHWRYVDALEELYRVPVVLDNTQSLLPTLGSGEE